MGGFGMGFGAIWMILVLILVVLAIAALIKYLRNRKAKTWVTRETAGRPAKDR